MDQKARRAFSKFEKRYHIEIVRLHCNKCRRLPPECRVFLVLPRIFRGTRTAGGGYTIIKTLNGP